MNSFSPLELTVIALSIVLMILLCCFLLARSFKKCRSPFDVETDPAPQVEITFHPSVELLYDVTDWFGPEEKPTIFGLYKTRIMIGKIEHITMALWTEFGWRDPDLPQFDCYYQERGWKGSKVEILA